MENGEIQKYIYSDEAFIMDQKYVLKNKTCIKSLAVRPVPPKASDFMQSFVATTISGDLYIFDLTSFNVIHERQAFATSDRESPDMSTVESPLAWHPSGQVFAVGTNNGVAIIEANSGNWVEVYRLSDGFKGTQCTKVLCLDWSPNGRFLATGDIQRYLFVWDFSPSTAIPFIDIQKTQSKNVARLPGPNSSGDEALLLVPRAVFSGALREIHDDKDVTEEATTAEKRAQLMAEVSSTATRIHLTGVVWNGGANSLLFVDSSGYVAGVPLRGLMDSSNSITAEPDNNIVFPLIRTTIADEVSEGKKLGKKKKSVPAKASYVDNEAAVSEGEDELDALDEPTITKQKSATNQEEVEDRFTTDIDQIRADLGLELVDNPDGEGSHIRSITRKRRGYDSDGEEGGLSVQETLRLIRKELEYKGMGIFPQPPFQSSSTRHQPRDGLDSIESAGEGIMSQNSIGIMLTRTHMGRKEIIIEFANSSERSNISIMNDRDYSLGVLGPTGVLLAARYFPPIEDKESRTEHFPAILHFHPSTSTNNASSWTIQLPVFNPRRSTGFPRLRALNRVHGYTNPHADIEYGDDLYDDAGEAQTRVVHEDVIGDTSAVAESPVCLAIGDGWMAACTDQNLIRFFRMSGVQDVIVASPGKIVTCAGKGALFAVAYHSAAPFDNTQQIQVDLYLYPQLNVPLPSTESTSGLPQRLFSTKFPMRAYTTLTWMDFSSTGMLFCHISDGSLFGLNISLGGYWMPYGNTFEVSLAQENYSRWDSKKNKVKEILWPISIMEVSRSQVQEVVTNITGSSRRGGARIEHTLKELPPMGQTVLALQAYKVHKSIGEPIGPFLALNRSFIPLRIPLIHDKESSFVDESYLLAETVRLQRLWALKNHLDATFDVYSAPVRVAIQSAHAKISGFPNAPDSIIRFAREKDQELKLVAEEGHQANIIDNTLLRAIGKALMANDVPRALNHVSRLHSEGLFNNAGILAEKLQKPNVVEYVKQLGIIRSVMGNSASARSNTTQSPTPQISHARSSPMGGSSESHAQRDSVHTPNIDRPISSRSPVSPIQSMSFDRSTASDSRYETASTSPEMTRSRIVPGGHIASATISGTRDPAPSGGVTNPFGLKKNRQAPDTNANSVDLLSAVSSPARSARSTQQNLLSPNKRPRK